MTETQTAIRRSISHNEIVTIDYTEKARDALVCYCDDSVDARLSSSVFEFWGMDDDGNEWRVHLHDPSYDSGLDDAEYDAEMDRLDARRARE